MIVGIEIRNINIIQPEPRLTGGKWRQLTQDGIFYGALWGGKYELNFEL